MNSNNFNKIGFFTLLAIIINAQLGSSIFLLPSKLAIFGPFGLIGWIIGGLGAVFIATIFAFLCIETSNSGGPHIYAKLMFGEKIGFFVTWLYWCGAWASNPILISTSIDYLEQFIGNISLSSRFIIEILILVSLTIINIRGIKSAGMIESFMVVIKLLPLILVPILALFSFNIDNLKVDNTLNVDNNIFGIILNSSIIAFWGFIGLEEGGTTTDSVKNPQKTIPLAIILGTIIVAIVSLANTISIFGIIPCNELKDIKAPFAVVLGKLLGGNYNKIIGLLTFIMCYGSLNAWILFGGKIAQTASTEKIFPPIFGKVNKHNSPYVSLIISTTGTISILAIIEFTKIKNALVKFLDMSVVMYVILYLVAILSYFLFICKFKKYSKIRLFVIFMSLLFCTTILVSSNIMDFTAVILLTLCGMPIYLYQKNKLC